MIWNVMLFGRQNLHIRIYMQISIAEYLVLHVLAQLYLLIISEAYCSGDDITWILYVNQASLSQQDSSMRHLVVLSVTEENLK